GEVESTSCEIARGGPSSSTTSARSGPRRNAWRGGGSTRSTPRWCTRLSADGKLPVDLVTGFLGSGKTTLISRLLRHRGMVATVDAVHGLRQRESVKQAAAADTIVVTKTDLAEFGGLAGELARLNPTARILAVAFGDVDPAQLFGGRGRDFRELVLDDDPHD